MDQLRREYGAARAPRRRSSAPPPPFRHRPHSRVVAGVVQDDAPEGHAEQVRGHLAERQAQRRLSHTTVCQIAHEVQDDDLERIVVSSALLRRLCAVLAGPLPPRPAAVYRKTLR